MQAKHNKLRQYMTIHNNTGRCTTKVLDKNSMFVYITCTSQLLLTALAVTLSCESGSGILFL